MRHVQQAVGERGVRSGPERQMQRRPLGGRCPARIGDDQLAAVLLLRLEVLHDAAASSRPGCRRPAGSPSACGMSSSGNGSPRSMPNASTARPPPTTCRSGRCSRCWPCRAPRARTCRAGTPSRSSAIRRRRQPRRRSVASLDVAEARRHALERRVPSRRLEPAARAADERRAQTVGMSERRRRRPSLDAQPALVDRKPRVADHLEMCRLELMSRQMHPALQRAVRTVRRDAGRRGDRHPLHHCDAGSKMRS